MPAATLLAQSQRILQITAEAWGLLPLQHGAAASSPQARPSRARATRRARNALFRARAVAQALALQEAQQQAASRPTHIQMHSYPSPYTNALHVF